jgi:hypothetical protein
METETRRKIPKILKDTVSHRQRYGCCCCLSKETDKKVFHHILAWSIGKDHINSTNLVLMCERCHRAFHLGNFETIQSVYEYAWYLQHGKLPENKDIQEIATEVEKTLRRISLGEEDV